MIQAIGLTSLPSRSQLRPVVDDLTFEARPGRVTVLLGPEGAGKTTALRLMLQLQSGRGTALFRGRPVHRIQHLAREVGVLLGEVNGHPGRTVRGHLRMLAAAAGVSAGRADDVLDVVGLSGLADQRMSALSRGMDRRLGMACVLLGDPHTLVLDEPARDLSPRETAWMYSLLRGYANQGGTALITSHDAEEAAKLADRVVSIESGRLLADQEAADFTRTRLRPRVAVRTPHVDRLVAVLTHEGRKAGRNRPGGPLKVVREGGTKVSVYGSSCAEVGEYAYKNNILVHQLSDEQGDAGDTYRPGPLYRADGRRARRHTTASAEAVPAVTSRSAVASRSTHRPSAAVNGTDTSSAVSPEPSHAAASTRDDGGRDAERNTGSTAVELEARSILDELGDVGSQEELGDDGMPSALHGADTPAPSVAPDRAEAVARADAHAAGAEPDSCMSAHSSPEPDPDESSRSERPAAEASAFPVHGHSRPKNGAEYETGVGAESESGSRAATLAARAAFAQSAATSATASTASASASPAKPRASAFSEPVAGDSSAVPAHESLDADASEAPTIRNSEVPLTDSVPGSDLADDAPAPDSQAASVRPDPEHGDLAETAHIPEHTTVEQDDSSQADTAHALVDPKAKSDANPQANPGDDDARPGDDVHAPEGVPATGSEVVTGAAAETRAETGPTDKTAAETATGSASVTGPAQAHSPASHSAEEASSDNDARSSSARRPIVMKPLADPDARDKAKSLWAPSRPPARAAAELPPQLHAMARPGPAAPMRYELCRLFSVRTTWISVAVTVAVAACVSLVMARTGVGVPVQAGDSLSPAVRILTGWPSTGLSLMPPVAIAAGLLGAFAFGEEFRYPALAPARSPVPRRFSLLAAKLAVSAAVAVGLGIAVALVNAALVTLFFGSEALAIASSEVSTGGISSADGSWELHLAAVFAFTAGCAWAGVLASGIFKSGVAGAATVLAVPLLLAPVVRGFLGDGSAPGRTTEGLPQRLEAALLVPWPSGTERWVTALLDVASQPVGLALTLSLVALLIAYVVTAVTGRSG